MRLQHGGAIAAATDGEVETERSAAALDEIQVEVDDVPADDEVRIRAGKPGKKSFEQSLLVGAQLDARIINVQLDIGDHENDGGFRVVHRDRVQLTR